MSRVRILRIGIASHDEVKRRTMEFVKGTKRRGPMEPRIWFTSYQALAQVLSKKNQALLDMIRASEPASMTELAKLSGRSLSNLQRTLNTFERYGLIEFEIGEGQKKAPRTTFDKIETAWTAAA